MKKLFTPLLFALMLPATFSCSALKNYTLTESDAAAALKQMLELGARESITGSFSREAIMTTLFPEALRKTLNTLQQLGLTNEIDRFTTTLSTAAEQTANQSIPVFVSGINRMSFTDAIRIVKDGGTSATSYLRSSIGTDLRNSVKPVMASALEEYKLNEQWERIIKPVKGAVGDRLNLDLSTLMAGMVTEAMFRKMEEKEIEIRANAAARTTPLLKRVFG